MVYRGNVVYVWLLDHRGHGLVDRPIAKLIVGVFIPDGFEVKVRSTKVLLQERQTASMRHACCRDFERMMSRNYEAGGSNVGVTVCLHRSLGGNF